MNTSRSLLAILLLGFSCLENLQARSLPDGERHRFVRRRISPDDPDLEIIEVKEVYYVRRPKKVVIPLEEDEIDWRIRCDFEPNLPECRDLVKNVAPSRPTTTTTTTTKAPTTTRSTTRRTTTTPEPLLDESMERKIRCDNDPTREECAPSTTTSTRIPDLNETEPEPELVTEPEPQPETEPETEPETVPEPEPEDQEEETGTDSENDIENESNPESEKDSITPPEEDEVTEEVMELPEDDGESVEDAEDQMDQEDEADAEDGYDTNFNDRGPHSIGDHDDGDWN
ncbi:proteoglycan 4 [Drosophila gunungcola]|uniref:Uncharacterized protein n=1 Tax=Drosophila gunungcola TaxID=103775 RepID=A0A9P9YBC4_9MUSC|nr:proteoglycan 4 [Drosophila gunungcola]KAI8033775.1 hypothetical protein M5D96_013471 [Drosophila gunungcola]